jgi:hypothetical protein
MLGIRIVDTFALCLLCSIGYVLFIEYTAHATTCLVASVRLSSCVYVGTRYGSVLASAVDRHHFDANPDTGPTFHFDADPRIRSPLSILMQIQIRFRIQPQVLLMLQKQKFFTLIHGNASLLLHRVGKNPVFF